MRYPKEWKFEVIQKMSGCSVNWDSQFNDEWVPGEYHVIEKRAYDKLEDKLYHTAREKNEDAYLLKEELKKSEEYRSELVKELDSWRNDSIKCENDKLKEELAFWKAHGEVEKQMMKFRARCARLEECLRFVEEVSNSPEFVGVFQIAQLHGMPYTGWEYGTLIKEVLEETE